MTALTSVPALDRSDLLAPPVVAALTAWAAAAEVAVAEIDPAIADTAAMMEAYSLPMSAGANCVVVAGRREGVERIAACVVRSDTRADVNGVVRKALDVRKSSFLPQERAVAESSMEYGGITPIGLPTEWRLLIDPAVLEMPVAIIGSGVRRSKILLAGSLLGQLPAG